jgi:phosphoserine phosphatase
MPSSAIPLSRAIFLPKSRSQVLDLWAGLGAKDAVCFDVDSTVIVDECIDELAEFVGVGQQVQEVTNKAMGGRVNFRCALRERLNIIRPSQAQVENFIAEKPPKLTPGIKDLVTRLQSRKITIYLVSGGFERTIQPIADILNIPHSRIVANKILFDNNGEYAGFDETAPTSVSGGKALAVSMIKEQESRRHVVMIGDGATDAEACPPANAFIGFGGNVVRDNVRRKCYYYALDFNELTSLLEVDQKKAAADKAGSGLPITFNRESTTP